MIRFHARLRAAIAAPALLALAACGGGDTDGEAPRSEPIAAIPGINELNIGHAIIARALFSGLAAAVTEMRTLIATGEACQ